MQTLVLGLPSFLCAASSSRDLGTHSYVYLAMQWVERAVGNRDAMDYGLPFAGNYVAATLSDPFCRDRFLAAILPRLLYGGGIVLRPLLCRYVWWVKRAVRCPNAMIGGRIVAAILPLLQSWSRPFLCGRSIGVVLPRPI